MHLPNGDVFPFETCHLIIAAGAESGHIANLAGMGIGKVIFFYQDKKKILVQFLFNRSWRISTTPNTTNFFILFKLIQQSNMVILSCLAKKNQCEDKKVSLLLKPETPTNLPFQ